METAEQKLQELIERDEMLKTVIRWLMNSGMNVQEAVKFALGHY